MYIDERTNKQFQNQHQIKTVQKIAVMELSQFKKRTEKTSRKKEKGKENIFQDA